MYIHGIRAATVRGLYRSVTGITRYRLLCRSIQYTERVRTRVCGRGISHIQIGVTEANIGRHSSDGSLGLIVDHEVGKLLITHTPMLRGRSSEYTIRTVCPAGGRQCYSAVSAYLLLGYNIGYRCRQ